MSRAARIRSIVACEEGIALVLAVIVLMIAFVAAGSAIYVMSGSQQDAYSKKARQSAYTLAQGGLSNGLAQLTKLYYDDSGQPIDDTSSLSQMDGWYTSVSGSQQSPSSTALCTSSTPCMSWSAQLNCPNYPADCPHGAYTAVSGSEKAAWHITATGTMPNPSGTAPLSRTITVDVPVNQAPAAVTAPDIFKAVYSGKPDDGACDMTMGQGVTFTSPLYVVGNLCIDQHSGVESPGTLVVGGWVDTGQKGHVGLSSAPVSSVTVGGACDGTHGSTPACTLTYDGTNHYYALASQNIYSSAQASNSPSFPSPPSVDWAARQADSAGWSCTGGQDLNAANFDPAGSIYSCTTPAGGLLSWDGSTLHINGNIYLSGNLVTSNNEDIVYSGIGSIYVNGTASFGNNSSICVGSTSHHDCPDGANWDTTNNFLLILSKGQSSGKNLSLEGGLYSDANIDFGSGQTNIYGPMVTPQALIPGQQAGSGFPDIEVVFSGAPDTSLPYWTLGSPTNGTY